MNYAQIIRHTTEEGNKLRIIQFINDLKTTDKLEYEIIVKPYKKSKTLEQLGYFFSTVIPICKDWQGLTDLEADIFLKENCMSPVFKEIMGKTYEIRKSIAKMLVDEMRIYIDDCVNFLGINGIYVPPPTYKTNTG